VRVAVVQQSPRGDAVSTTAHQVELIRSAATRGARLIVLPEGGLSGFALRHDEALAGAQPLDGAYVAELGAVSASLGVAIVTNLYVPARVEGRVVVHNTSVLIEQGALVRTYRKIHLFDAQSFCESACVEGGDAAQLLEPPTSIEGVAVSLATCFDLRFAELAVTLARRGADLIAVPAAWVAGTNKLTQWDTLLRARAIETGCFVAGAAQPGPTYCGGSAVYGPEGEPAGPTMGRDEEGTTAADVDHAAVVRARATTPTLRHRPVWDAR